MPTIYEQIPIRCALAIVSNPPVAPIDDNTGQKPRFFRASGVAIYLAIFDPDLVSVDLTNLAYLQLILQSAPDSIVPLVTKTVVAADITKTISRAAWLAGTGQQAVFVLDPAETDQGLDAETEKDFWMLIRGVTEDGVPLDYGAGYVTIAQPSAAVPLPPFGYVSENEQSLDAGDITVQPTSLDHTEWVAVGGVARLSNIILSTVGMARGALLRLRLDLTATPDVILRMMNASIVGTQLSTITTDAGSTNALLTYVFNGTAWRPLSYQVPCT